jgi:predicted 3-demethylubiquinone-9 3-methyltransferase (glyoxalase superfamily)
MIAKDTICLWYDKDAEEAAHFYAATFPSGKTGDVLTDAMAKGGDVAKRPFKAMMTMQKIDVAAIEAAVQEI